MKTEEWLIRQLKSICLQGTPQVYFDSAAFAECGIHTGFKETYGIATLIFRLI